jgi:hypothetical protein
MGNFKLFNGKKPQMNNNSSMSTKTSMYASKTSMYKPRFDGDKIGKAYADLTDEERAAVMRADYLEGASKLYDEGYNKLEKLKSEKQTPYVKAKIKKQTQVVKGREKVLDDAQVAVSKDKNVKDALDQAAGTTSQRLSKGVQTKRVSGSKSETSKQVGKALEKSTPKRYTTTINKKGEYVDTEESNKGLAGKALTYNSIVTQNQKRKIDALTKRFGSDKKVKR